MLSRIADNDMASISTEARPCFDHISRRQTSFTHRQARVMTDPQPLIDRARALIRPKVETRPEPLLPMEDPYYDMPDPEELRKRHEEKVKESQ